MRTTCLILALLVGGALGAADTLEAQGRWNVEVRAGAGLPLDDLGEARLDGGFGFDASVGVRVVRHLSVYGGWGWHHLPAEAAVWGADPDLEQTGYRLGLRWEHPLAGEAGEGIALRLEAGGTLEHFEVEDPEGDLVTDSELGPGWEAGAALTVPAWGGWRLAPGVRYRALSRELAFGELTPEVFLDYLTLEVGLSRSF